MLEGDGISEPSFEISAALRHLRICVRSGPAFEERAQIVMERFAELRDAHPGVPCAAGSGGLNGVSWTGPEVGSVAGRHYIVSKFRYSPRCRGRNDRTGNATRERTPETP